MFSDANPRSREWCRPSWLSGAEFANVYTLVGLGCAYIVTSAGMIAFNKYLMHEGRFPYAVPLVLIHSAFSSCCALLLFIVRPSLFTSLTSAEEKVAVDRNLILRGALPIALLFSVQLVLSNTAYLHSSMAFLQMMKESNLVLVYCFSLIAAMEIFCWTKVRVVVLIVLATTLTIQGELNFSWDGFALQGTSQLFESLKIVLQALLLSSAGRKLDVLTYVIVVMPLCFCVLGSILCTLVFVHPVEHIAIPRWADILPWWRVLAANAALAFVLNVTIALFMKRSSAVGFILAGIAKDAVIVFGGVIAMDESMSRIQLFGFISQLCLIWLWSLMKLFPEKFEGGISKGLMRLTSLEAENKSLLPAASAMLDSSAQPRYGTEKAEKECAEDADQC
jgi:hypothetical protein